MKFRKCKIILLLAIIMLGGYTTIVKADNAATTTFGTGKYTRAVTRISWWMSYENNGGWYEYQIINAVKNWQNPGWTNPLKFVAASSNSGTMMDIHTKDNNYWPYQNNVLAETSFYDRSGNDIGTPKTQNYWFTRIFLNDSNMHNLSANNMKGTIAHEIGHTLGLRHNNTNQNSIMCQTAYGRKVQTVQKVDNTAVVNFYK